MNATVEYTMEWTLLIISEAQIDVVGIEPSEQQVIKGDGSKKMTVRNERLVGKLEPMKTSLEAQPPMSNMTTPQVLLMDTSSHVETANSFSKHFTTAHTTYTVAASASTESLVFEEFVRNNQEEEMYDSLLLYGGVQFGGALHGRGAHRALYSYIIKSLYRG